MRKHPYSSKRRGRQALCCDYGRVWCKITGNSEHTDFAWQTAILGHSSESVPYRLLRLESGRIRQAAMFDDAGSRGGRRCPFRVHNLRRSLDKVDYRCGPEGLVGDLGPIEGFCHRWSDRLEECLIFLFSPLGDGTVVFVPWTGGHIGNGVL